MKQGVAVSIIQTGYIQIEDKAKTEEAVHVSLPQLAIHIVKMTGLFDRKEGLLCHLIEKTIVV